MLELKNINVSFRSERQDKIFGHTRQQVLFDVSLAVKEGTCLGILGESGSGKSTMGRVLCGLLKPDSGEAVLDGVSVYASRAGRRNLQNKLSIVFQDYTTSANPRFRIRDIIGEGLTVQERREGKKLDRKAETSRLLELVGLPADFADRFPHELSGGQLQRVCIARAVAYLTVQKKAAAGVVISASHNPYEFNGIKIFGPEGYKLTDDEEDEIERMLLDRDIPMIPVEPEEIGTCREDREAAVRYAGYLASTVPERLEGMRVLVDCSNGAAVRTAEELFSLLGAEATILCDAPDGTNINRECGSTHVEHLASLMAEGKYDLAVAFDGDADRCLAVDEKGHVVNGDQMIAIFARQMKAEGRLPGDAAVVTVMSSFGFFRFAREQGIHAETTKVGDRYVLENMRKNGYNIGGEQSGHIIFREYMPTGDGELSAIQLMRVMKKTGEPLSVLAGRMPVTPQVLLNVAADRDMKEALHESPEMEALIEECEERLGDTGRILIRASGTEPLIRVMVEGEDAALIRELAERLAAGCEKLLK